MSCGLAQGTEKSWIKVGYTRNAVIEDRRAVGYGTVILARRIAALAMKVTEFAARGRDR